MHARQTLSLLFLAWAGSWVIGLGANTLYWIAGQYLYEVIVFHHWTPDMEIIGEILTNALTETALFLAVASIPGILLLWLADKLVPAGSTLRRPVWAALCGGLTGCILFLVMLETVFRPIRFDLVLFSPSFFAQVYGKNLFTAFLAGATAAWSFTRQKALATRAPV